MAGRFRSAATGVRRRQAALLSVALGLACALAYKYSKTLSVAANSVSTAAVQVRRKCGRFGAQRLFCLPALPTVPSFAHPSAVTSRVAAQLVGLSAWRFEQRRRRRRRGRHQQQREQRRRQRQEGQQTWQHQGQQESRRGHNQGQAAAAAATAQGRRPRAAARRSTRPRGGWAAVRPGQGRLVRAV